MVEPLFNVGLNQLNVILCGKDTLCRIFF